MTKPFSYRGKIISASSKSEAISKITANKKKGGGSYRSTTKESKTSRDRKEINLILKSIRDVAKSSGLVTDFTAGGDELIHGKDGIKDDNSFSIFACDYNSGYVVRGIKGYYSTYTPDLRACKCILQFKVNLKSDSLFTILSAYSRIALIIAKYTKKDKSAWSKFATELHKIDLDKLKSDKESARDNAKKEAENCLKTMEAKVKKTGAKIIKSQIEEYNFGNDYSFYPYVLFSFNNVLFGGTKKYAGEDGEVKLTLSLEKLDYEDIGSYGNTVHTYYKGIKADCSNVYIVLKKSVQKFQKSIKSFYETTFKNYDKVMKVKV